jgi:hypothetical protein
MEKKEKAMSLEALESISGGSFDDTALLMNKLQQAGADLHYVRVSRKGDINYEKAVSRELKAFLVDKLGLNMSRIFISPANIQNVYARQSVGPNGQTYMESFSPDGVVKLFLNQKGK